MDNVSPKYVLLMVLVLAIGIAIAGIKIYQSFDSDFGPHTGPPANFDAVRCMDAVKEVVGSLDGEQIPIHPSFSHEVWGIILKATALRLAEQGRERVPKIVKIACGFSNADIRAYTYNK